jgi:hypothetical protein
MKLAVAMELRSAILSAAYEKDAEPLRRNSFGLGPRLLSELEDLSSVKHWNNLAIGYSFLGGTTDGTRLEVRVPFASRKAANVAARLKAELGDDVNIRYIRSSISLAAGECKVVDPRHDELHLGLSIGSQQGTGTLGGFAQDEHGSLHILSCSHVLAMHPTKISLFNPPNLAGLPVFHPGPSDKKPSNWNAVASLKNYTVFTTQWANRTDSATALVAEGVTCAGNVIPLDVADIQLAGLKVMDPPTDDELAGLQTGTVYKLGKVSGLTKGRLGAIGVDQMSLEVAAAGSGERPIRLRFDNLMTVEWEDGAPPFSASGDSGSLVFTRIGDELHALGLVFATYQEAAAEKDRSYKNVTLICSMKDILDEWNMSWVI